MVPGVRKARWSVCPRKHRFYCSPSSSRALLPKSEVQKTGSPEMWPLLSLSSWQKTYLSVQCHLGFKNPKGLNPLSPAGVRRDSGEGQVKGLHPGLQLL